MARERSHLLGWPGTTRVGVVRFDGKEVAVASLEELMIGVEGLALLRTLYDRDAERARADRLNEVRRVVSGDPSDDASATSLGNEYGIQDGYVAWAETYDRPLRLFQIEEAPMHARLDAWPPGPVLDAACGTGRYAAYLAARGHDVIGVDQSAAMLERARTKVPAGRFLEGELTRIPVDDAAVDGVVCALALVHVDDLERAFHELGRVLRPGGRLVISDVHPFLVMLGWQAQFPVGAGRGFMRLHPHLASDYLRAAARAGLVVRSCEEPRLTAAAAATPTADLIPDANRAAYVGLPGVIVWEFMHS
jgi:SAM-dependent methyltransferase